MTLYAFRHWHAPLLLLAFSGVVIKYFDLIFTTSTRWVVLALAFFLVLRDPFFKSLLRKPFMVSSLVFCIWAMATYLWSEVPELSLMKGGALFLVVMGGTGAGYLWERRHPIESALDALAPLTFMVIAAGVFGPGSFRSPGAPEGLTMYQGLTGNSNMLGSLCAMAFPFPLWKYYTHHGDGGQSWWVLLVVALLVLALLSNSRASIVTVIFIALGLYGVQSLTKVLAIVMAVLLAVGSLMYFFPDTYHDLETRYFYKGSREAGALSSRETVWATSYDQAVKGGFIGGGYGVTIGNLFPEKFNLSSSGYGREKANSQFGIIEETGLVGFFWYLVSVFILFLSLMQARKRFANPRIRGLLGIIIGSLAGLTFQSIFEAWFNAPGSPECLYYWVLAGIGIGLATDPRLSYSTKKIPTATSRLVFGPRLS